MTAGSGAVADRNAPGDDDGDGVLHQNLPPPTTGSGAVRDHRRPPQDLPKRDAKQAPKGDAKEAPKDDAKRDAKRDAAKSSGNGSATAGAPSHRPQDPSEPSDWPQSGPAYAPPLPLDAASGDSSPRMAWPPPEPSAVAEIGRSFFSGDDTLGDAAARIHRMLARHGYGDLGWFVIDSGFAVATRCERIDASGEALRDPRFSTEIPLFHEFSWTGILKSMFRAPSGRFRVMLVVMTTDPGAIRRRAAAAGAAAVQALGAAGGATVPEVLWRSRRERHAGLILFYEISKRGEADPVLVADGLTAGDHLRGSGLEVN